MRDMVRLPSAGDHHRAGDGARRLALRLVRGEVNGDYSNELPGTKKSTLGLASGQASSRTTSGNTTHVRLVARGDRDSGNGYDTDHVHDRAIERDGCRRRLERFVRVEARVTMHS